jgi:endonuclease YncB( thermonuclease family)
MKLYSFALSLLCVVTIASAASSAELVRVIDGDTIVVSEEGKELKVRMAYIDAPEIKQPYGVLSRVNLWRLLSGQSLSITNRRRDLYRRTLGVVLVNEFHNINLQMIADGCAWAYRSKRGIYYDTQVEAAEAGKGLWSNGDPEPPWEYRKRKRKLSVDERFNIQDRQTDLHNAIWALPCDLGVA